MVELQIKIRSVDTEEYTAASWDIFYDLLVLSIAVELGKTSWGIFDSNLSSSLGTPDAGIDNLPLKSDKPRNSFSTFDSRMVPHRTSDSKFSSSLDTPDAGIDNLLLISENPC